MGQTPNKGNLKNETIQIDLLMLGKALWKHAWLIILAGIVCGLIAFLGTHLLVTPKYLSSFTAYVNNRSNQENDKTTLSNADLSASQSLVKTYAAVISSRSVLEKAAAQAGAPFQYKELVKMVGTKGVDDTEIIEVSVTMADPQMAAALAQAISEVAAEYITKIIEGSSMQIVDQAVIPVDIYSPNYKKILVLGVLLGIVLSGGVVVLKELLDDRIKDTGTLESRFGLAIIGTIPNMEAASKVGNSYAYSKRNGENR